MKTDGETKARKTGKSKKTNTPETELEVAKRRAMHLLGSRDYSRNELIGKLRENYSEETALNVAELMCGYGYVNDERYAEKLARQYITVRGYGKSRALQMMRQKGLEKETAETALEAFSEDDITGEITGLLRKKYADRLFLSGIEGKKEMQKIVAALARRGYGYNEIKRALLVIQNEMEEDQ